MNRPQLPTHKPHAAAHRPVHVHGGPSVALEMQIRALREALYRAARDTEHAQRHAHSLGETLRCERVRCADVEFRLKQLEKTTEQGRTNGVNSEAEIAELKAENRRLRSVIGDSASERHKLMEDLRTRPQRPSHDPAAFDRDADVEIDVCASSPSYIPARAAARAR